MRERRSVKGSRALEMRMRETADALEDLALRAAFRPGAGGFEILAIEPPVPATLPAAAVCSSHLRLVAGRRG